MDVHHWIMHSPMVTTKQSFHGAPCDAVHLEMCSLGPFLPSKYAGDDDEDLRVTTSRADGSGPKKKGLSREREGVSRGAFRVCCGFEATTEQHHTPPGGH